MPVQKSNAVQIFNNPKFGDIRTSTDENGEPLFCLADLCRVLGIVNSRHVKSRLDLDDVVQSDTIDSMGRHQSVTFVTESGMYDVIIRSDSSDAKPFRKYVTSEVLPSIRKHGFYGTPRDPMEMFKDPNVIIGLLQEFQTSQNAVKQLEAVNSVQQEKIQEDAPYVVVGKALEVSKD